MELKSTIKEILRRIFNTDKAVSTVNIIGLVLCGLLSHPAFAAAQEVPLYGLYETTLDYQALKGASHTYEDPFYGAELQATFVSPTGKTVTWWGFFDGDGIGGQDGNIWKIRFMPDELGTWNFTWQFSDGSLNGAGSFVAVSDGAKPGPLKHDPIIHQWLVSADGSRRVILNMLGSYLFPGEEGREAFYYIYQDPQKYILEVKENGFDVFWNEGGTHLANEKDFPMDQDNPYHFIDQTDYIPRLAGWHKQESGLFQVLYDEEVYLYEFAGFYAGNSWQQLYLRSTSLQDSVIKYWIARTAPYYFFLYNIGFELSEFVSVPSWPVERAQFVKDIDPWDHLITGHELNKFSYANDPVMDYSAIQDYAYVNYHSTALSIWNSPEQPHPHVNEGLWDAPWGSPSSETDFRKATWDALTGGMSFALYLRDGSQGLSSSKYLNNFLQNGIQWWLMSPHDEIVVSGTAFVLANLGVEYIAYSSSGSSFDLDISTGSYQSRWFDPATGTYLVWSAFDAVLGTPIIFSKPDSNDWVLQIDQGTPDTTLPTTPSNLEATPVSNAQINLIWTAASDSESGISSYKIYRNSSFLNTSTDPSFSDTDLTEDTTYSYEVSAVNGSGLEGSKSLAALATTFADVTAPSIVSAATGGGDPTTVSVTFSEPVESASAATISNYSIDNGVAISNAVLETDLKTVTLTTSSHTEEIIYTLMVNNVIDRASTPNPIVANSTVTYQFMAMEAFDTDVQGWVYVASAFRGTTEIYNEGLWDATGGNGGGALRVDLGKGVDGSEVGQTSPDSGGWQKNFSIFQDFLEISFDYRLVMNGTLDLGEYAEVLVSVNGVLAGVSPDDYVIHLDGNGGVQDTGWTTVTITSGDVGAGTHEVTIGGYLSQKSGNDENVSLVVDNVALKELSGGGADLVAPSAPTGLTVD